MLGTREREKEASDQELEWRVVNRLPPPTVASPNALVFSSALSELQGSNTLKTRSTHTTEGTWGRECFR